MSKPVCPWLSRPYARKRWERLLMQHGAEHPATRAALGRLIAALDEQLPEVFAGKPCNDAPLLRSYLRAIGDRGWMNRSARRAFAARLATCERAG